MKSPSILISMLGVLKGDRILEIDGKPVGISGNRALWEFASAKRLTQIRFQRGGDVFEVKFPLVPCDFLPPFHVSFADQSIWYWTSTEEFPATPIAARLHPDASGFSPMNQTERLGVWLVRG